MYSNVNTVCRVMGKRQYVMACSTDFLSVEVAALCYALTRHQQHQRESNKLLTSTILTSLPLILLGKYWLYARKIRIKKLSPIPCPLISPVLSPVLPSSLSSPLPCPLLFIVLSYSPLPSPLPCPLSCPLPCPLLSPVLSSVLSSPLSSPHTVHIMNPTNPI